jgi:hypothetical protein
MRYAGVTLLCVTLVVGLGCFLGDPADGVAKDETKPPTGTPASARHVQAPPVSFIDLVRDADRIFVGSVMTIAAARLANSELKDVPVEEVSFRVEKVLKGKLGKVLTIHQAASIGVFREKSGPLLIYLAPDSRLGLTQPIGIYSGYFKFQPDPTNKEKSAALNLHGNEGLWGEAKLIVGDVPARAKALIGQISLLKTTDDEKKRLVEAANRPKRAGPVPEDLLIAATKVLIQEQRK